MSWPASLSMLNATLMRFVDGIMVSFLGPIPLTAQFYGGLAAFVPESFATGMLGVVNTYVSQNSGANRPLLCGQYTRAGVVIAILFCLLIAPLALVAGQIFALMGHPPELASVEAMYFQYMIVAVFITLTARPLEQFFYGVHRPRIVLLASICSNVVNPVLGYLLIFGVGGYIVLSRWSWGVPIREFIESVPFLQFDGMGLRGGAIANIISWGLQLAILLAVYLSPEMHRQYGTRRIAQTHMRHCLEILRLGWPPGLQFLSDVLPWMVMIGIFIAPFGLEHMAASSVAMRWMPLSFMPAVGIGIATTALVGKYIGAGRKDLARSRAHTALALALVYMGCCGLAFLLLRDPMVRLFISIPGSEAPTDAALIERTISIGGYIMICAAVFQLFDAVGIVYMGALRGAGDTLWPMVVTVACSCGITLGGGYAFVNLFPRLTSIGPWIAGSLYVVVVGSLLAMRFESGKWRKIDLLRGSEPPAGS